jgi:hypothetical protein
MDMFPPSSDRSLVEWVAADMSAAPPVVALGAMESAMSFDREIPRALQELKLPVVAINPDYRPTSHPWSATASRSFSCRGWATS